MRFALQALVCAGALAIAACGPKENNGNNGETNGDTNGETNGTTNGETNGDTNGETNGTTNGTTNGMTGGTNNPPLMGDCSLREDYFRGEESPLFLTLDVLDDEGRVVDRRWDDGGDGTFDARLEFDYDADGRMVEERRDEDMDGDWEVALYWEYDADGNLTAHRWDQGVNGNDEFVELYTYDADGQLTEFTRDGVLGGPQPPYESGPLAEPADDELDYHRVTTWHGVGLIATDEFDTGGDGVVDAVHEITYDDQDRPTEETWDGLVTPGADASGDVDPQLIEAADGDVDLRMFDRTFDADGNITSFRQDGRLSTDGTLAWSAGEEPIATQTREWTDGNLTREATDFDEDGTEDFVVSFEFDADGNGIRTSIDGIVDNDFNLMEGPDGTADLVFERQYEDGQLIGTQGDWGNDGTDETISEIAWNANGKRTLYRTDGRATGLETPTDPADGTWDQEYTYTYDDQSRMTELNFSRDDGYTYRRVVTFDTCSELF